VEVLLHVFVTSAPDGVEWSTSRASCFTSGERALGTHRVIDWVHPRAGVDAVGKEKIPCPSLSGIEMRLSSSKPSHYTDWAVLATVVSYEPVTHRKKSSTPVLWCWEPDVQYDDLVEWRGLLRLRSSEPVPLLLTPTSPFAHLCRPPWVVVL
jgi:hypothetical protein